MAAFRVVQPWGADPLRQSTLISEHATAMEAFAAIESLATPMRRTGAPSDAIELVVVDGDGQRIARGDVQ